MTASINIAPLAPTAEVLAALTDMLMQVVADGASVSFLHPLERDVAEAFWRQSLSDAGDGGRIVLGAFDQGALVGTVTLLLDMPQNQQHRGEIAKLMTRLSARRMGLARALMQQAEQIAISRGRRMLTLDTATVDGAGPLYEKLGYTAAGVIPD